MDTQDSAPVTVDDFLVGEDEQQADAGENLEALDVSDDEIDAEPAAEADEQDESLEAEAESEEEAEPAAEVIPPPVSWSKEDAKAWEALTPEVQAVVARREQERDRFVRDAGRKAAETKTAVENQAREFLAQQAEEHAIALSTYAQQFQPKQPDPNLLYTGNPDDVLLYQRQDAAYRAGASQQQQLQQAIAQAQQQARAAREQAEQVDTQVETQRLQEQLPEWFDPSAGPKLKADLQSIGAELGYPAELMANANATDIIALKKAFEWKAKAERFDRIMSKQMEKVRSAKAVPKMARPGATPGKGQVNARAESNRDQALQSFGQSRSGEAAAALLLQRTR